MSRASRTTGRHVSAATRFPSTVGWLSADEAHGDVPEQRLMSVSMLIPSGMKGEGWSSERGWPNLQPGGCRNGHYNVGIFGMSYPHYDSSHLGRYDRSNCHTHGGGGERGRTRVGPPRKTMSHASRTWVCSLSLRHDVRYASREERPMGGRPHSSPDAAARICRAHSVWRMVISRKAKSWRHAMSAMHAMFAG